MKWFVKLETGYCGSTCYEIVDLPDHYEENDLDDVFFQMALENAEIYGYEICADGDDCEDDECEYEHLGSSGIDYNYKPYEPEKHDKYSPNGKW